MTEMQRMSRHIVLVRRSAVIYNNNGKISMYTVKVNIASCMTHCTGTVIGWEAFKIA